MDFDLDLPDFIPSSSRTMHNQLGQPSKSPIFNLNMDLLWQIFMMNADMEYDPPIEDRDTRKFRALNVIRSTSQVSLHWRRLILASPSLWASVVDLELFTLGKDEWRREVMQRSGKASLSVKGVISEYFREWRLSLIKDNWSRIRKLDITVTIPGRALSPEAFGFLFQPTKCLESFTFGISTLNVLNDPFFTLNRGLSLFADDAPSLWEFHSHHIPLSPKSPWLPQICRLHISDTLGQIFNSDEKLYLILNKIPLLESLRIVNAVSGLAHDVSQPPIRLPRLKEFMIVDNDMGVCWSILQHILPQVGCSVNMSSPGSLFVPRHGFRLQSSECLSRYTDSYFGTHHPSFVVLKATPRYFKLGDAQNSSDGVTARKYPVFDIDIQFQHQSEPSVAFFLLSTIFSCSFSSVICLEMEIGHIDNNHEDPGFLRFLLSFSSVEVLKTNRATLELLCMSFPDISAAFPRLRILKIVQLMLFRSNFSTPPWPSSILIFFFARRKEGGVPVEILDLSLSWESGVKDLGFLEQISGLRVIWKYGAESGEYLCGSGEPGELDFTDKYTPFLDEEDEVYVLELTSGLVTSLVQ